MDLHFLDLKGRSMAAWLQANWRPGWVQVKWFVLMEFALLVYVLSLGFLFEDNAESTWFRGIVDSSGFMWFAYSVLKDAVAYGIILFFTWISYRNSRRTSVEAFQWGVLCTFPLLAFFILPMLAGAFVSKEYFLYALSATPTRLYGMAFNVLQFSGMFLFYVSRWHRKVLKPYLLMAVSFAAVWVFTQISMKVFQTSVTDVVLSGINLSLEPLGLAEVTLGPLPYVLIIPAYISLAKYMRLREDRMVIYFYGVIGFLGFASTALDVAIMSLLGIYRPLAGMNVLWMLVVGSAMRALAVVLGSWLIGRYGNDALT